MSYQFWWGVLSKQDERWDTRRIEGNKAYYLWKKYKYQDDGCDKFIEIYRHIIKAKPKDEAVNRMRTFYCAITHNYQETVDLVRREQESILAQEQLRSANQKFQKAGFSWVSSEEEKEFWGSWADLKE